MIGKKVFLATVEKLNTIYPDSAISPAQVQIYYETLSPDFTDEAFLKAANDAVKNSFKFPPIAAFYKGNEQPQVYCPVTDEERILFRRMLDKEQGGGQ